MKLNRKQHRHLKSLAHKLKPVVIIGSAGLTDNIMAEVSIALDYHELIKIRVNAADKKARTNIIASICDQAQAELVFAIGHVATVYRQTSKQKIALP